MTERRDDHLDELLRSSLVAEAGGIEADPALLDRIHAELSDGVGSSSPGAGGRVAWLVAAAVVVVAALGGLLWALGDRGGEVRTADVPDEVAPGPDPVDDPTTTTQPVGGTTTSTEAAAGDIAIPDELVAVREDGWLVLVDLATGDQRELLFGGNPFDEPEEGGPRFIDGVERSPDGDWIYFSTCCEPAPGTTYRISRDGGEPERLAQMAYPAVSPDGRHLAGGSVHLLVVTTSEPVDDAAASAAPAPAAESLATLDVGCCIRQVAWSPEGTGELLAEIASGLDEAPQVRRFRFDGGRLVEVGTGKPDNPGEFPTWSPDGMSVTQQAGDPGTLLRDRWRSLSRDASNRWILTVEEGGRATFRTDESPEEPLPGLPPLFIADW